jgi:hypothetical protein
MSPPILPLVSAATSAGLFFPKQMMYILPVILTLMLVQAQMVASTDPVLFGSMFGSFAILLWYWILQYTNRQALDKMPENWYNNNIVIAVVTIVHFLFLAMGGMFSQGTYVTMAVLVVMVTLQHVTATHFRTNG